MIYINNKDKIKRLKRIDDYCVILDFDRTITTKESDSSLGVLPNYIGGEFLETRTKIHDYYRPKELDYSISTEEKQKLMKEWAFKSFELLTKHITEKDIDKATDKCNMHLRPGAKEFLSKMNDKKIPVIILSGGMGNVIESFLKKQEVLFDNTVIVSNFIEFINNKPRIDYNNIISTSNKTYLVIPEETRKVLYNKDKILLFGDIVEDIKMVSKDHLEKTITIGFLDQKIKQNLEIYNKNYDIVLTDSSGFNMIEVEVI